MKKKDASQEAAQTSRLSAVMAGALLFLGVVLSRSAAVQLKAGHAVSGWISIIGAVLFLGVGLVMLNDLRKQFQQKSKTRKE